MKKYLPLALLGAFLILVAAFLLMRGSFDTSELALTIPANQTEFTYTSPEITRPIFNALFIKYQTAGEGEVEFSVAFDAEDANEATWKKVHFDGDTELGPTPNDGSHSGYVLTAPTREFRFRAVLRGESGFTLSQIDLETSDTRTENFSVGNLIPAADAQMSDLKIISRAEWKADPGYLLERPVPPPSDEEPSDAWKTRINKCNALVAKYPYEFKTDGREIKTNSSGEKLQWPKTYSQEVAKIIVHHTDSESVASEKDLTGDGKFDAHDAEATMRAIYRFHAVTRGWGDVGYNYLIDPFGNVYEGREGGERVIAAHTYCANTSTIGVAFMGEFGERLPTPAALSAGAALLGELANQYNIDPVANVFWHDKDQPGVVGHRDYGASLCPGEKLYAYLPTLREEAARYAATHKVSNESYSAKITAGADGIKLAPLETKTITLTFQNNGRLVWPAGTQIKSLLVNRAQNRSALAINNDRDLVATLGNVVVSGATASFTFPITAKLQAGNYSVSLVPFFGKQRGNAVSFFVATTGATVDYEVVGAKHPPRPFAPGAEATAWIELKNKSSFTWRAAGEFQAYLGTTNPVRRASEFANGEPELGTLTADTPPGAVGRFVLNLTAPEKAGIYKESFAPAIRNFGYLPDYKMYFDITVREPKFEVAVAKKSEGREATFGPGETKTLSVTLKNTSQLDWEPAQFEFVPFQNTSFAYDAKSLRLAEVVKKGATTVLNFRATAPVTPGNYSLAFQPKWHNGKVKIADPITLSLNVTPAQLTGTLLENPPPFTLVKGATQNITFAYKNTGNVTWNQKDLVLQRLPAETSALTHSSWLSVLQPAKLSEASVAPGEIGHFTFLVQSPGGRVREEFVPIVRGLGRIRGAAARVEVLSERREAGSERRESDELIIQKPTTNDQQRTTSSESETSDSGILNTKYQIPNTNSIRIRLGFVSDRVEIGGGDLTLVNSAGKQIFAGTFVDFEKNKLQDGEFYRVVPSGATILEIANWRHTPGWSDTVNDNLYRGILEVRRIGNELRVINELPLEEYLRGVAEPLPTDPSEKIKLLAILARSYALYYTDPAHRKYPGAPYDGSDNPAEFQKYIGYNYEARGNMPDAVEATRGLIVTHAGKVVKTPYFTSSGGRTKTVAEARWSLAEFPFIKSVPDPWSCGLNSNAIGTNFSCPENARGHGVGVSGTGATGLAREGKTYRDIINYFYKDVKVEAMK